jgi:signal transduction histidine kinase
MACVSVRDEGPGLPSTEQQLIWQCFYRTPGIGTQDGSSGGLGMGLFICRSIIERHRGQVGVQSEPGRGSTFWFTLPCITSELETGNAGESN